jgi:hypothetical protein
MSADALSSAFTSYVHEIENELQQLKCLSNLSAIDGNSDTKAQLGKLDETVSHLEERLHAFDCYMDSEFDEMDRFSSLLRLCKEQSESICAAETEVQEKENFHATVTKIRNSVPLVSPAEFAAVPITVRERVQLMKLNEALTELHLLTMNRQSTLKNSDVLKSSVFEVRISMNCCFPYRV